MKIDGKGLKIPTKKRIRKIVSSISKYSPNPPQTPEILDSLFLNNTFFIFLNKKVVRD